MDEEKKRWGEKRLMIVDAAFGRKTWVDRNEEYGVLRPRPERMEKMGWLYGKKKKGG